MLYLSVNFQLLTKIMSLATDSVSSYITGVERTPKIFDYYRYKFPVRYANLDPLLHYYGIMQIIVTIKLA